LSNRNSVYYAIGLLSD